MKYSLFIEPNREEEVIIYAHEKNDLVFKIEELLVKEKEELFGYSENEVFRLDPANILCFEANSGKVFAITANGKFSVKLRLYQLEEMFPKEFLKINQSCLIRVDKIKRFNSSIGGSLTVTLEGGYKDYISRRQLKKSKRKDRFLSYEHLC